MNKFKPSETAFIGLIKKQIENFIKDSEVIDEDVKREFIKEVGSNWYDNRFDGTKFIDDAVGFSVHKWQEQNFKLTELWKEVAVNNAKVSNDPHIAADEVVDRFKERFNCEHTVICHPEDEDTTVYLDKDLKESNPFTLVGVAVHVIVALATFIGYLIFKHY